MFPCRTLGIFLTLIVGLSAVAHAAQPSAATDPAQYTLVLNDMGKGLAPLDGHWQFHLGDDPAWSNPAYDDSGWEQLTADKPWSLQLMQS
jgi:diguanylate cyclase